MSKLCSLRSFKTPTVGRRMSPGRLPTGLALALVTLGAAARARAEAPVDRPLEEADVIRLALERAPQAAVARASEALAEARARTAGRLSNPKIDWSRETVETGPVGSQDIVTVSWPVDVARPLTARAQAASDGAWTQAEAALARTRAALAAALAYYEVVLAERRVALLADAARDLDEAARVLARRESAGSASGYESARLSIARELGRSRLAEAEGALARSKVRLAVLLDVDPEALEVSTALAPMPAADGAALAERGAGRPALAHARRAAELAEQAESRAAWAWLPSLELAGGVKRVSDLGGGVGYVVGVSLGLPIFDWGQALREGTQAQRALSAARADALLRRSGAEMQAAFTSYRTAQAELERFEMETVGRVDALLAAAASGYREGERTIVELLDAQRARAEVAERQLALLGLAKRAEARLRAAAGDLR